MINRFLISFTLSTALTCKRSFQVVRFFISDLELVDSHQPELRVRQRQADRHLGHRVHRQILLLAARKDLHSGCWSKFNQLRGIWLELRGRALGLDKRSWVQILPRAGLFSSSLLYPISCATLIRSLTEVQHY